MSKLMKACASVLTVALAVVSVYSMTDMTNGGNGGIASLEVSDIANLARIEIPGQEGALKASEKARLMEDESKGEAFAGETAYAVAVDGEDILYVATEEDAKAVLDGIIANYTTPGSEIVEILYGEEISYKEKDIVTAEEAAKDKTVTETYICQVDEAVRYILNGTAVPLTYTVQGGDTLWDIAIANNISVYELEQMNPGATERLSVGQTLNLYQQNPFVHVTVTEIVTDVQSIPYDVSYTSSDALYKGQIQVQSAGESGSKEVTSQVTKVNGIETASVVLAETVLTEPVTQIALMGTKQISIQTGSGYFQYPVASVEISSGYGASRGEGSSITQRH